MSKIRVPISIAYLLAAVGCIFLVIYLDGPTGLNFATILTILTLPGSMYALLFARPLIQHEAGLQLFVFIYLASAGLNIFIFNWLVSKVTEKPSPTQQNKDSQSKKC